MNRSTFLYVEEWDKPLYFRYKYTYSEYPWNDAEKCYCIPLGFAICTTNICVRREWSKQSEFIATLEVGTCVLVVQTDGWRAKIYFGEDEFGWCTIYKGLPNEIYLLRHISNQQKASAIFKYQHYSIDQTDLYEDDFVEYLEYDCTRKSQFRKSFSNVVNFKHHLYRNRRKTKFYFTRIYFPSPHANIDPYKYNIQWPLYGLEINLNDRWQDWEVIDVKENSYAGFFQIKSGWKIKSFNGELINEKNYQEIIWRLNSMKGECSIGFEGIVDSGCIQPPLEKISRAFTKEKFNCKSIIELKNIPNTKKYLDHMFYLACQEGNSLMVKCMMEELKITMTKKVLVEGFIIACEQEHFEIIKILVKFEKNLWKCKAMNKKTPLRILMYKKSGVKIIKYLLDNGLNIEDVALDAEYVFLEAYWQKKFELVKLLQHYGINLSKCFRKSLRNTYRIKCIKYLLENGLNIEDVAEAAENAFLEACYHGNFELIELLEYHGVNIHTQNNTALVRACKGTCEFKIVRFLVEKGIHIDATETDLYETGIYKDALYYACSNKNLEVIAYLLDHGADVMKRCHENIFKDNLDLNKVYCKETSFAIIQLLVSCGSYVQLCPTVALEVFERACDQLDMKVVQFFMQNGLHFKDKNICVNKMFLRRCQANCYSYYDDLAFLLKHGASVHAQFNDDGDTAFIFFCKKNSLHPIRFILEYGANMEDKNKFNETGFICACKCGHLKVVEFLLQQGVNTNARDRWTFTGFLRACQKGKVKIVKLLLDHMGEEISSKDIQRGFDLALDRFKYTRTYFSSYCPPESGKNHSEILKMLLDYQSQNNLPPIEMKNFLKFGYLYAIQGRDCTMLELLYEYNAEFNIYDKKVQEALYQLFNLLFSPPLMISKIVKEFIMCMQNYGLLTEYVLVLDVDSNYRLTQYLKENLIHEIWKCLSSKIKPIEEIWPDCDINIIDIVSEYIYGITHLKHLENIIGVTIQPELDQNNLKLDRNNLLLQQNQFSQQLNNEKVHSDEIHNKQSEMQMNISNTTENKKQNCPKEIKRNTWADIVKSKTSVEKVKFEVDKKIISEQKSTTVQKKIHVEPKRKYLKKSNIPKQKEKQAKINLNTTWADKVKNGQNNQLLVKVPERKKPIVGMNDWDLKQIIIPLGYAICTSCICVRADHSKNSEFITNLEQGYRVIVVKISDNRAKILFNEMFGWCTIFSEREQRYLLSHEQKNYCDDEYFDEYEEYDVIVPFANKSVRKVKPEYDVIKSFSHKYVNKMKPLCKIKDNLIEDLDEEVSEDDFGFDSDDFWNL